jgi:hypothetical protein
VIVAPRAALPGGLLAFDPDVAAQPIERGERDAWRALREAGWVAPDSDDGP